MFQSFAIYEIRRNLLENDAGIAFWINVLQYLTTVIFIPDIIRENKDRIVSNIMFSKCYFASEII